MKSVKKTKQRSRKNADCLRLYQRKECVSNDCFIFTVFADNLAIKLLFEVIFTTANRLTGNIGLSIIILSLTVNLLVLPLYKRADELQAEDRDIQKKMAPMIKHIKKTFKGMSVSL